MLKRKSLKVRNTFNDREIKEIFEFTNMVWLQDPLRCKSIGYDIDDLCQDVFLNLTTRNISRRTKEGLKNLVAVAAKNAISDMERHNKSRMSIYNARAVFSCDDHTYTPDGIFESYSSNTSDIKIDYESVYGNLNIEDMDMLIADALRIIPNLKVNENLSYRQLFLELVESSKSQIIQKYKLSETVFYVARKGLKRYVA